MKIVPTIIHPVFLRLAINHTIFFIATFQNFKLLNEGKLVSRYFFIRFEQNLNLSEVIKPERKFTKLVFPDFHSTFNQ